MPRVYRKLVFIAYFNAGVRAVDIRDPYAPREAALDVPATTERTAERCVTNGARSCKVAIQTNNAEADERGFDGAEDSGEAARGAAGLAHARMPATWGIAE
jgi:hypothetical protein